MVYVWAGHAGEGAGGGGEVGGRAGTSSLVPLFVCDQFLSTA